MSSSNNTFFGIVKPALPVEMNMPSITECFTSSNFSAESKAFLTALCETFKFVSPYAKYLYLYGEDGGEDAVAFEGDYENQGVGGMYDLDGNLIGEGFLSCASNIAEQIENQSGNDFSVFDDVNTAYYGGALADAIDAASLDQWYDFEVVAFGPDWEDYALPAAEKYLSDKNIYELIMSGDYQTASGDELYGLLMAITEIKRRIVDTFCTMLGPFSAIGSYTTGTNADGETVDLFTHVDDETMKSQFNDFFKNGIGADLSSLEKYLFSSFFTIQANLHCYMAATLGQGDLDSLDLSAEEKTAFKAWHTFINDKISTMQSNLEVTYLNEKAKAAEDQDGELLAQIERKTGVFQEFLAPTSAADAGWSDEFSNPLNALQPYYTGEQTAGAAYGWDAYSAGKSLDELTNNTNATEAALGFNSQTSFTALAQTYGYSVGDMQHNDQENWVVYFRGQNADFSDTILNKVIFIGFFNFMTKSNYNDKMDEYNDKVDAAERDQLYNERLANKAIARRRALNKQLNNEAVQKAKAARKQAEKAICSKNKNRKTSAPKKP
jgi:hypothetical protein